MSQEDAGDKQQVAAKKSKAKLREEQADADLRALLNTREGRASVWRILQECGVYHLSFSSDHGVMSFNEGKRKMGLWLIATIHHAAPNAYLRMQAEAQATDARYGED